MSRDRSSPPSDWLADVVTVDPEIGIYAAWGFYGPDANPVVWPWCPAQDRWVVAGTPDHDLISREPLHLEPSLSLPDCCGLHGYIRDGKWVPA